ncbi:hypothetical protein [Phenylobacterium montanum]|uniref:Transmembrane protein n=1 Tax=Phenylobacterium montanum TaxID=2823693 RepID=A0A975IUA1_9CAUL|nr:hypothetical protein [Caulobacter sp. S6]QUD87588.1 hypothetical protein KCG34_21460 [Caulobacter sp. S6]
MSSAARTILALLSAGSGAMLIFVGGFIWWAEPTPAYRLTSEYRLWHTWGSGLFIAAGALLICASAAICILQLSIRKSN